MAATARQRQVFPLAAQFSWATAPGQLSVGRVPSGVFVRAVVVIVDAAFDSAVAVEVGTIAAPAELVLGGDSNLQLVGRYNIQTDREYSAETELFLNLIHSGPAPTTGAGSVLLYLN